MTDDSSYFMRRAAYQARLALEAKTEHSASAHRELERLYLERATAGAPAAAPA